MKLDIKSWARKEFLENLVITPHYQPIIDVASGTVFGYEALSRFTLKGENLPPLKAFRMAEDMDLVGELDSLCREKAITEFPKDMGVFLFLNIFPSYLTTEFFGKNRNFKFVVDLGLKPETVVLEITEAEKIKDSALFKRAIGYYKDMGFQVGIDDLGTGYNSLQILLELEGLLDFVKLPRELVNGVSRSKIKHHLLKVLSEVSLNIGAKPVYEGIEQEEDLKTLFYDLGAQLYQGFYFARPMKAEEVKQFRVSNNIRAKFEDDFLDGEVLHVIKASRDDKFGKFLDYLEEIKSRYAMLDIGRSRYFVDLWRLRFSINQVERNLYYYKSLDEVLEKLAELFPELDSIPQFLPETLKINNLLDTLLSSNHDVLLLKSASGVRVVERQRLLDLFYKKLSKELLDKNPLTQLPGNNAIKDKVQELVRMNEVFYICYIDLDNFKSFNDTYGFYAGDQMIKKVGFVLNVFLEKEPLKRFVGHIGGDDFVIILWSYRPDELVREVLQVIKEIQQELLSFYSSEDRERGYFLGKDRDDNLREFPIASVSAVLLKGSEDMIEISKRAALYKKKAKAHRGSALFVEHLNEILTINL